MIKDIGFFILLAVFLLSGHDIHAEQSISLSLDKQWEKFIESPSGITIVPLTKLLEDKYKTLEFFEKTIEELQMEALEGDEKSLRLIFTIKSNLYFDLGEKAQEIIDQTVDYAFIAHPKVYLEEVYKVPDGVVGYKDHLDVAKLESDDFYSLIKEYKQRTQALQKADISDKKVKILKYRIIKDLKNEIALHKRWEEFVENPEPKKIIVLTRENDWSRTKWLRKKIEQGNLNALKAAIILSEASSYKSDERTLGLLHCAIASAIITHPQMYIEQLYKNPAVAERTLTCTETSVMGGYDFDAMVNIFEQRIKVLQKLILIDKDQDKFRHKAINSLKDTIQNIKTEFLSGNPYKDQQSAYSLNPKMETMLEQQWQALMEDPSDEKVERLFDAIYKADESSDGFDCSKWLESKIMMFQTILTQGEKKFLKQPLF